MISTNEATVYGVVRDALRWLSAAEIAQRAGMHVRTVRNHTRHLVAAGVFRQAPFTDGFLYQLAHRTADHDAALSVLATIGKAANGNT
jgi:DNA-binding IclR family transcriptional regulator